MKFVIAFFLFLPILPAQTKLEFDVAAIKPANPDARGTRFQPSGQGGISITNATLRQMILQAYNLRDFQLTGGSSWVNSERFDVQATALQETTDPSSLKPAELAQARERLFQRAQNLLKDRFGVVLKREIREQPAYALSVAKGGHKLKAAEVNDPTKLSSSLRGEEKGRMSLTVKTGDMPALARVLAGVLDRPVVDRTGLAGLFDFQAEWVQDLQNDAQDGPSVFTALQEQLGLKLDATRAPVEVYTIEKAEHPTEN